MGARYFHSTSSDIGMWYIVFGSLVTLGSGIEAGMVEFPLCASGYMELTVCALYTGDGRVPLGTSPAWEVPPRVVQLIRSGEAKDMNEAFIRCGLTDNPQLGRSVGAIGLLSKGKINRKDYTQLAVMMALMQLENESLYTDSIQSLTSPEAEDR